MIIMTAAHARFGIAHLFGCWGPTRAATVGSIASLNG